MKSIKQRIKGAIFIIGSIFKWKKEIPITTVHENGDLLKGKVALITGGSGGIGMAIARKFLDCGCKVIISGTNEAKLQEKCKELGGECSHIVINMMDVQSFPEKIEQAAKIFGRIDILVCSHGIHTKRSGFDFLNVTEQEYDNVMDVNLKGTYFICQIMAKYMISNKVKGHILIISSHRGLEPSWSPYRLSKRGLGGVTEGLAQKLINPESW